MFSSTSSEISIIERILKLHRFGGEAEKDEFGRSSSVSKSEEVMKSIIRRNKEDALVEIFLAEIFGTSCLMYFGCMGLFASLDGVAKLPPMQAGLVFGFVVASLIVAVGHISNAHLNPTVTLCAYLLGKINIFTAVIYFLAECIGCFFGFWMLKVTTPHPLFQSYMNSSSCGFCTTTLHPTVNPIQGFFIEFFASSLLIYVVCSVWDSRNERNTDATAIKFGLLIAALSIAAGPFTGASLNPARSLGPAIINNVWTDHWIYWTAPMSASLCTTFFYKFCFLKKDDLTDKIMKSPDSPTHESKILNEKSSNVV